MIEQSKINEARETAKRRHQELSKLRPKDSTGGFGGNNTGGLLDSTSNDSSLNPSSSPASSPTTPSWSNTFNDEGSVPFKPSKTPPRGMLLSSKRKGDVVVGLYGDVGAVAQDVEAEPTPAPVNPLLDPLNVEIEEKITANLSLEGGLNGQIQYSGCFQITVLDTAKAGLACFKIPPADPSFKFRAFPNLNKASHQHNVLEVKDPARAFSANEVNRLLTWNMNSTSEDLLPVGVVCWPTQSSDGGTHFVLEYDLQDKSVVLENVVLQFAPSSAKATITNVDTGEAAYFSDKEQLVWKIPVIDADEPTGTLECSVAADQSAVLPITFEATRPNYTRCPMEVLECYHQEKKDPISYTFNKFSTYVFIVGS